MGLLHNRETPCMLCENRNVGCHGSCTEYKNFRNQLNEYNQLKRNAKKTEDDFRVARGYRASDGPTFLRKRQRGRIV